MKRLRLFYAVWPPDALRQGLWRSLALLREALPDVRWIPPRRLHITLRFMGGVPVPRLPRLISAAEELEPTSPFRLRLAGTGTFPVRGPPRVYWAGVRGEGLPGLRERLDRALANEGVAPDNRTFHPHLTVGRARKSGSRGNLHPPTEVVELPELAFTVTEIHLVRSDLLPSGPRYTNLHRAVLGSRGG